MRMLAPDAPAKASRDDDNQPYNHFSLNRAKTYASLSLVTINYVKEDSEISSHGTKTKGRPRNICFPLIVLPAPLAGKLLARYSR